MTDNSRSDAGSRRDPARGAPPKAWPKAFNPLAPSQYSEMYAMHRGMVSPVMPFVWLRYGLLTAFVIAVLAAAATGLAKP